MKVAMQTTKEVTVIELKGIPGFLDENGQPWFLLRAVCQAAEMENNSHVKDRINPEDTLLKHTPTAGGIQEMLYVNESGLYAVIGGSRKSKARALCQALLKEIPSLRQNNQDIQRIAELEERIAKLERGGGHLLTTVPEIADRARLNMIIRKFVGRQVERGYFYSYPDAWRELYYQFYYRYHHDLKACARNRKCDVLDYAESKGFMGELVNLAGHIFTEN
jgi:prophage antirepressor-like protein